MMDEALKTHKEVTFGWVLALRQVWTILRAPSEPAKHPRLMAPR